MDKIQTNIENVTLLWATAAKSFESYYVSEGYSYGYISESQWPNKIWLHGTPSQENLRAAAALMKQNKPELSFIYFDIGMPEAMRRIQSSGFQESLFLYGMSLQKPSEFPKQPKDVHNPLEFESVSVLKDRIEWGRAFKAAFGYTISEETLARTYQLIQYYLLRSKGQTVGTLAIFWMGTTMGIYSMGILPEARGRGYALEAMQKALNQSVIAGAETVVLQASDMGLPMYQKLGFTTDFIMRNFTLKSKSNEIT